MYFPVLLYEAFLHLSKHPYCTFRYIFDISRLDTVSKRGRDGYAVAIPFLTSSGTGEISPGRPEGSEE